MTQKRRRDVFLCEEGQYQTLTLIKLRNRQPQGIQELLGFTGDFRQNPGVFDFDFVDVFEMGNEIRNGEFGKQVGSAEPVINQVGQQEEKMVYRKRMIPHTDNICHECNGCLYQVFSVSRPTQDKPCKHLQIYLATQYDSITNNA